jgi:branched-chain amino acid transport system permease protein
MMKKLLQKYSKILPYLVLIIVCAVTAIFGKVPVQNTIIMACLFAYLGAAWNLVGGFAGQFSFGHAAFFGLGAYTSTILFVNYGISPLIGMLAGGVVAAILGLFIGYLTLRYGLTSWYFSLTTLAFAETLQIVATNIFPGKAAGIPIPLNLTGSWTTLQFNSKSSYLFMILIMLILIIVLCQAIRQSKLGYFLIATREDENAAEALGVNTFYYRIITMGLSAFLTALGGTFYAQFLNFIDPASTFNMDVMIEIVIRPIVGGVGTVWGPVIGSFIITPLADITNDLLGGGNLRGASLVIYGFILIVIILFAREGVGKLVRDRWFSRQKTALETRPLDNQTMEK